MRNKQKWQQIIEQWEQSGVSQAEFCRLHNLDTKQFYNWKYRLEKSPGKKNRFIKLSVPKQNPSEHHIVELHLPNGIMVKVSAQISTAQLQQILQTAGAV